jgi:hypothetical protein
LRSSSLVNRLDVLILAVGWIQAAFNPDASDRIDERNEDASESAYL